MLVCRSQHKGRWDEEEDASEMLDATRLDAGCGGSGLSGLLMGLAHKTNGIWPLPPHYYPTIISIRRSIHSDSSLN